MSRPTDMPDSPPITACASCSACCDHPEPWSQIDLTLGDMQRIPEHYHVATGFGNIRKMKRQGNRCVALIGTIGIDARCSIYSIRPQVCRNFDPATRRDECNMCRKPHGLPDLP